MSLEDWNGIDRFMAGEEPEEWGHLVMQSTPEYMEAHQEAQEQVEEYRKAYMYAFDKDADHLVNPSTKYSTERRGMY